MACIDKCVAMSLLIFLHLPHQRRIFYFLFRFLEFCLGLASDGDTPSTLGCLSFELGIGTST